MLVDGLGKMEVEGEDIRAVVSRELEKRELGLMYECEVKTLGDECS